MPDEINELLKKFEKIGGDIDNALDDAVGVTAQKVLSGAVASIRSPSVGIRYYRGNKSHLASAVGEAPNTDTGDLIRSIKVIHKKGSAIADVGTPLEYGAILELLKSRPWLNPALESEEAGFYKNLKFVLDTQIKKASE